MLVRHWHFKNLAHTQPVSPAPFTQAEELARGFFVFFLVKSLSLHYLCI